MVRGGGIPEKIPEKNGDAQAGLGALEGSSAETAELGHSQSA